MGANTLVQMTQAEFKELLTAVVEASVEQKLLELLGDPDEGLRVRYEVEQRLLRQQEAVAAGERGRSLQSLAQDLGLE